MKYTQLILCGSALLLVNGCAMKTKLLDVNAVSMTQTSLQPGAKLKEKGPVTGQFCANAFHDEGTLGLMDEAIKSAQQENHVDFITGVTVWQVSNGCVQVEGTGQTMSN
jgi:hypothetical protein